MLIVEQIMQLLFYLYRFNKYRQQFTFTIFCRTQDRLTDYEERNIPSSILFKIKETNENGIKVEAKIWFETRVCSEELYTKTHAKKPVNSEKAVRGGGG